MKQHKKFELIQILRALAIINIYLYHQGLEDIAVSRWGVCCFFLISGFLSAYHKYGTLEPMNLTGAVKYGTGKIKKLFPLHVIMLVVAFLSYLVGSVGQLKNGYPVSVICCAVKLILNLFLLSDWVPHFPAIELINGEYNIVTWFLSANLLFFILTPYVFGIMHRLYDDEKKKNPYMVMGVIYAYVIISNLLFIRIMGKEISFWHIYESPVSRIGDYLIGAQLGYMFYQKTKESGMCCDEESGKEKPVSLKRLCLFGTIIIMNIGFLVLFLIPGISEYRYLASTGFYYTIPISLLMVFAVNTDERIQGKVAESIPGRILVWIGDLSPYIFLIHYPLITGFHGVLRRIGDVNIPVWTILSASATLILSFWWDLRFGRKR